MIKKVFSFLSIFILTAALFLNYPSNAAELQAKPDVKKIDAYVERMMKENRIPGFSLAIVRGGEVIYTQGYGIADPTGRKVTSETPFQVASVSKTFTALAVMQLADEGRVSLDEPVCTYLPWFELADKKASQAITVRELLTHTSGLGPYAEFNVASVTGEGDSIGWLIERMRNLKPTAPHGTKFQYNNANYIILGKLIQIVSGMTYEDYIRQNIFEPLGMAHSYFITEGTLPEEIEKYKMAVGYRTIFGFPAVSGLPYRTDFTPATGVITCSEDLAKYMLALMNDGKYGSGRVLSADSLALMREPHSKISKWESYGLGWYVTSGSYYHGGELTDYQSKLKILPDESLGMAFVYNTSSNTATSLFKVGYRDRIESGIINILYDLDPDDVPSGGILDLNRYPVTVTYGILLALCLLTVFALIFSFIRLAGIRKRLAKTKWSFAATVLLTLAVYIILPIVILRIPGRMGFNWEQIIFTVPDVGCSLLFIGVSLFICGIVRVLFIKGYLFPPKRKHADEKHMYSL